MNFPCCVHSDCVDPANPVANFSAEAPDPEIFIGYNFGGGVNNPPQLGWDFRSTGCQGVCLSTVSQLDADLCAQSQQIICDTQNGGGGNGGGGGFKPPVGPPTVFGNAAQHCDILCPDGLFFRFTVPANSFQAFSQSYADQVAQSVACLTGQTERMCLSSLPNGCVNSNYSSIITPEGGSPPYTTAFLSGSLPPGLFISITDQGLALIEGTPTTPGNFTFTVRVTDHFGIFMVKTYTIAIVGITNTPPSANKGTPYSFTFIAAGGTAPYSFSLTSGALPDGLSMNSSGTISGTPTNATTFDFTVQVTDSA
jgi:hypothetical protein